MSKVVEFSDEFDLPEITSQVEEEFREARDMAFEAWAAETREERLALAKRAFEKSPYCIDALNIMASESGDAAESIKLYEMALKIGRKFFGEAFFKENKGIFWGLAVTRPYMRAKNGLSMRLRELGDRKGAMAQLQEMLELCENDNLGARYELLPMLVAEGDLLKAKKVARKYEEDGSAELLYGLALLAFAQNGPGEEANQQLANAVSANREAIKYLAGKKKMPEDLPDSYSLGSKEEAVVIAWGQLDSWQAVPGACDWLASRIPARRSGGRGKARSTKT